MEVRMSPRFLLLPALALSAAAASPTITKDHDLWFLCGAGNALQPVTATLTFNDVPGHPTRFVWQIVTGSKFVALPDNVLTAVTTVNRVTIRSLAASEALDDVTIAGRYNNVDVFRIKLTVRSPRRLVALPLGNPDSGRAAGNCNAAGSAGFLSLIPYEIQDQFNARANWVGINERLGTAQVIDPGTNWGPGPEGGTDAPAGQFNDRLCYTAFAGSLPTAIAPQNPPSTREIVRIPQTWFSGNPTVNGNRGCRVQTDDILFFIDHGRHINIVSPAP
jgi:hypothetical protein